MALKTPGYNKGAILMFISLYGTKRYRLSSIYVNKGGNQIMNKRGMVLLGVVTLSVILILTTAVFALSNKNPDLPVDEISMQQNQEAVFKEIKDGLEFIVTLDKDRFTLQDEIKVKLKVTNVSDKEIPSFAGVAAYGSVSVGISDEEKAFWLAYKPSKYDLPADQVVVQGNLQPGTSIEYERILLPKIEFYTEQIDVPGGTYLVSAGLTRNPGDSVAVYFPITIESNAKKILLPIAAEKVAFESEDYKKWFTAHSGNAVAWTQDSERFAIMKGELSKVGKELYEEILAENATPNKSTCFENGNWVVRSSSHYGKSPMSIIIQVDAIKGNIVSTEYADY